MKKNKNFVLLLLLVFALCSNIYAKNKITQSKKYIWSKVKIGAGGYIPGIITNPSEKGLIYARTDMGGAYKWDAEKEQWEQLMEFVGYDDWNNAGVESIATDPLEPNRLYIFAGMYNNNWSNNNAVLFRSKDYGKTFDKIQLPFKAGGNMPGRDIGERLMIDPNNNKIIYMGTRGDDNNNGIGNGLWKSKDYGKTWNKVLNFSNVGQEKDYFGNAYGIGWIIFDELSSQKGEETKTIFVGIQQKEGNKIYVSNDYGKTWKALKGQPLGKKINGKLDGMYAHKAVISNHVMYVTYKSQIGPYGGGFGAIYKYDLISKIWKDVTPKLKNSDRPNGIPFGGITVDRKNSNVAIAVTQNLWSPDELIFRTTDGGKTWYGENLWKIKSYDGSKPVMEKNYKINYEEVPWLNWGDFDDKHANVKIGWMLGDLEIDPFNSEKVLWASGASLYEAENISALENDSEKLNIDLKIKGIEETAVLDLISPPKGAELLSAIGDIGGFRHSDITKASKMITNPLFSTATDIDYAGKNPNFIVRIGNVNNKGGKQIGISEDNGKTWKSANNSWNEADTGVAGGTVAVSADAKVIIWSPGKNKKVKYSTDNGKTWEISKGLPTEVRLYSDRENSNKIYAFKNGKFYLSIDKGKYFKEIKDLNLPKKLNSSFKSVPGIDGDIWLVSANDNTKEHSLHGVWHSINSGKSFVKLSSIDEAACIGFGKSAPGKTYPTIYVNGKVNGVRGIYCSIDKGQNWTRINDDKHQYGNARDAITGNMNEFGKVYLATNGFGIAVGTLKK